MSIKKMETNIPFDAHVGGAQWIFNTPQHAQNFPAITPFTGSVGVPLAKEKTDTHAFQWLVYKPQEHAIPSFSYFANTRFPDRNK